MIDEESANMRSKNMVQDIALTIQSGGMIGFEKTGVYPEFLVFYSRRLRRTWRFKQVKEMQNGVLKVNGQVAFNYFFDGLGCRMQSLTDGVVTEDWEIEMVRMEMRD